MAFLVVAFVFVVILFNYDHIGHAIRAINRPGSQLLGANGRDDGPIVSLFSLL